jgi:hypothetical protein
MPAIPRSQYLIAHGFSAAGQSGTWLNPAGTVTLVKSLYAHNNTAAALAIRLRVNVAGGPVVVYVINTSVEANLGFAWQGWFVLHPSDSMWVECDAPGIAVIVSGAVLNGPPLYPPATQVGMQPLPGPDPTPKLTAESEPEPRLGKPTDRGHRGGHASRRR